MSPNDADGMANGIDPDQTAPLSESLGSLRYNVYLNIKVFYSSFQRELLNLIR